jgi:heat shock protein HslJ
MRFDRSIIFVSLALGVGCNEAPVSPSTLVGDSWQLVSLRRGDSTPISVDDPSRYTLQFTGEGRVAIKSDCNSCGGSYTLDGTSLSLGQVACTRAFCGEQSLDSRFVDALERARTVSSAGDQLIMEGDAVSLRFRR